MAQKLDKLLVDNKSFKSLFKIGEIVQSGGDPSRKNASRLRITAIDEEAVRFQPIGAAASFRVSFPYLGLLLDHFGEIDPRSIQKTVNVLRIAQGLKLDTTTENYAYGFAKAYLQRSATQSHASIGSNDDPEALPATRQGFQSSPAVRRAVENHAMEMAREHFASRGFAVETHGKPFDLLCTKENKRLYVEVKGTQGSGTEILLTKGEVQFHRGHPGAMALFIVSDILVAPNGQASGGFSCVKLPWIMQEERLTPYAFSYRI